MPLNNLKERIRKLAVFDLEKEVTIIINQNSEFLSDLLASQLAKGKDADGQNVTVFGKDYYSDATVFEKQRHGIGLGRFTEWVTNYMSGAFYSGLKVTAANGKFVFKSDVEYFNDILLRSGTRRVIELSQENLYIFRNEVLIPQLKLRYNGL